MARTNQRIFQQLLNGYEDLKEEYEQAIEQYFGEGEWNCNCDFFSDFAYTADSIYVHAGELASDINGMLQATKFEIEEKQEKYQNMLLSVGQIKVEIKEKFESVLELFNMAGGWSEIEQETLENLSIYFGKRRY